MRGWAARSNEGSWADGNRRRGPRANGQRSCWGCGGGSVLHELDIPAYLMRVQKRQAGLLKSDKRDALGLAIHLYNMLEKGVQTADPLLAVRRLALPTEAAAQLQSMVQHRQELVAEQTQRKNNLTAICDELLPEFRQICKNPNLPSALALRQAFPTSVAVATASLSALTTARRGTRPSVAKLLMSV
jgi:hypothetical protein